MQSDEQPDKRQQQLDAPASSPVADDEGTYFSYDQLSRRDIRALILHLLYSMDAFDYQESLEAIVHNYDVGFEVAIPAESEVFVTTQAIITKRNELDQIYIPLLTNWRFDRIGVNTKLILRFAVWELEHTTTDHRIVINEAVELAKAFAEEDAHRFINGILDRIVQKKVQG
jgi:transcription antitermination factor NusB